MNTKKHSFRAFTLPIFLVITLAILLFGCDASSSPITSDSDMLTDQTSSLPYSSPVPPDTSHSASIANDSTAHNNEFDSAIKMSDTPENTENDALTSLDKLTDEQKNAIVILMQRVVDGYHTKTLPLPIVPNSEYFLNNPIPTEVSLPQIVNYDDLTFVFSDSAMWRIKTSLKLNEPWVLTVYLSLNRTEDGVFININDASFENAN